jgi:hypothetical protein
MEPSAMAAPGNASLSRHSRRDKIERSVASMVFLISGFIIGPDSVV